MFSFVINLVTINSKLLSGGVARLNRARLDGRLVGNCRLKNISLVACALVFTGTLLAGVGAAEASAAAADCSIRYDQKYCDDRKGIKTNCFDNSCKYVPEKKVILPEQSRKKAVAPVVAVKTEAAKTEAAKTEAAKTEPVKTEAAKTEAAKTEAAKTEAAKTEPVKTEAKASTPCSAGDLVYGKVGATIEEDRKNKSCDCDLPLVQERRDGITSCVKSSDKGDAEKCDAAQKELRADKKENAATAKQDKKDEATAAKEMKKSVKDLQKELADAQAELRTKLQEEKAKYDKEKAEMTNVKHPAEVEAARKAVMDLDSALQKLKVEKTQTEGKISIAKAEIRAMQAQSSRAGALCADEAAKNKLENEKKYKHADQGALVQRYRDDQASCLKASEETSNAKMAAANATIAQMQAGFNLLEEQRISLGAAKTEAQTKLDGLAAKQTQELFALAQQYGEKITALQMNASQNMMRLQQNIAEAQSEQQQANRSPYLKLLLGEAMKTGDSGSATDAGLLANVKKTCGCDPNPKATGEKKDEIKNPDNKEICDSTVKSEGSSGSSTDKAIELFMQQQLGVH